MSSEKHEKSTASQVLVRGLATQGVTHIFGIPGGKIMPVFDALNDGPKELQLVVCRHEAERRFHGGRGWTAHRTAWRLPGHLGARHIQPCNWSCHSDLGG